MTLWKAVAAITNAFETRLNANFPKAHKVYMRIKTGTALFTKEAMIQFKVYSHYKKTQNLDAFTWKDIMIYKQMPKHWRKIAPVFILSLPPAMAYVVFPIAFMFPGKLLTPQFWTLEEKLNIYDAQYKKSLMHLKVNLLEHLLTSNSGGNSDTELNKRFLDIIQKLKNKESVDVSNLKEYTPLFIKFPFDLKSLSKAHLKDLATFFNCKRIFQHRTIRQLEHHVFLMSKIDELLPTTLESIDIGDLYKLAFQRGLNPINRDRKDLENYLEECRKLSLDLFKTSNDVKSRKQYYSFFLHVIILNSYNYTLNTK